MRFFSFLLISLLIFSFKRSYNQNISKKYIQHDSCAALIIDTYFYHKIVFDTCLKKNFVYDTVKRTFLEVDYPMNDSPYRTHFVKGLVKVRIGDMQGLMTIEGKHLVKASLNSIYFDKEKNIISANDFWGRKWIFFNFDGDVLSEGKCNTSIDFHYIPKIDSTLNVAKIEELDTTLINRARVLFGYLNKNARWAILPQFEDAKDFVNKFAKVKHNGKWGLIDEKGDFIVKANYDSSELVPTSNSKN